jgi:hypothetical protein
MDSTVPVFDFHNPWAALILLGLTYLLPRLVGLVTDKLAASWLKITLLGTLSIFGAGLTWLLDVAVANAWATVDWTDLLNVIVNSGVTFALAQGIFKGVIVPTGQAERDAQSTVIKLFGASQKRVNALAAAKHR